MNKKDAELLVNIYLKYHKSVLKSVKKMRGSEPKPYKDLEIKKLYRTLKHPPSTKLCMIDFSTNLISNLLRVHSLPNANHRTTIFFIQAFLKINDIDLPEYDYSTNKSRWWDDCDKYIYESKYWLKIAYRRKELLKQFKSGNRKIIVGEGVTKEIINQDLHLSPGEYRNKHRGVTKRWLNRMLSDQSDKCSKESSNSLNKFIAQWGISNSSKVI